MSCGANEFMGTEYGNVYNQSLDTIADWMADGIGRLLLQS